MQHGSLILLETWSNLMWKLEVRHQKSYEPGSIVRYKVSWPQLTIELSFNSNEFGRVLLVIPSMFGKLEVHASEVV